MNDITLLMGKIEGERPKGRPKRGWVDNAKIDLRERKWCDMGRIDQAIGELL
jgi:hypothetical protein